MIIYYLTCAKQIVKRLVPENDKYITTSIGATGQEIFCGHYLKELDKDGLFPEERDG